MPNCLAFTRPDGGVSVVHPVSIPDTLDALLEEVAKQGHTPANAVLMDQSTLPDRHPRLRHSWRLAGSRITYDLSAVRQYIMAEVRAERNKRLIQSDADKARLDDTGDQVDKLALALYRQQLRDLPLQVDAELARLSTPEALKAYTPAYPTHDL